MHIIHNGGFEATQTELYKHILMANLIMGMKQLLELCQDYIAAENRKKARYMISMEETPYTNQLDQEMTERIKTLWEDPAVQLAWKNRKESIFFQLEYLLSNIDRIISPDFLPNNDDILRARHRSTGEINYRFEDKKQIWNLVDVGGQYSERSKWVSVIDTHPHAILFFISLDEYDIANTEDTDHETKFQVAVSVYEEIMNGDFIRDRKICRITFLNKLDLFTLKLQNEERFNDFKERFEYNGKNDVDKCVEFITGLLEGKIKDKLPVHIHPICGLDTSLIKKLTQDIKISIIASSLQDMGIL